MNDTSYIHIHDNNEEEDQYEVKKGVVEVKDGDGGGNVELVTVVGKEGHDEGGLNVKYRNVAITEV